MMTLNTILKELKNVLVNRLEDLYSIIHSLRGNTKKSDKTTKKILSFAGSFNDMTEKDYNEFLQKAKDTRKDLFDRDINLIAALQNDENLKASIVKKKNRAIAKYL